MKAGLGREPSDGSASIPLLPLTTSGPSGSTSSLSSPGAGSRNRLGTPERTAALCAFICLLGLYWVFPTATTLHWYLSGIVGLVTWLIAESIVLAWAWRKRKAAAATHWTGRRKILAGVGGVLCLVLFFQGSRLPKEPPLPSLPEGSTPLLITMTVHDSAHLFPLMMDNLLRFVDYVGRGDVHISLLESSRSSDSTHDLLLRYEMMLHDLDIHHTVSQLNISDEHGYWVDEFSRDHINRHAFARNQALEPLEEGLRGQPFSKILFVDPVFFRWTDPVRLLATHDGQFDMACGLEWGPKGLSDAWSLRDRCGLRARPAYPYIDHGEEGIDHDQPFDVMSCWHSLAVLDAKPFLRVNAQTLRDAMLRERKEEVLLGDGRVDTGMATVPLRFHATPVEECAASEGMLLGYDLHLIQRPTRPRIYVNPTVNVAEQRNWYILYTRILRRPFVRPWVYLWDRWLGPMVLSAARELGRPAEQCQWQGFILADGCPPPANGALGLVT